MIRQELTRVLSNEEVMPGVFLTWLETPIAADARPGQFVMVRCSSGNEFMLRRPLSIHAAAGDKLALLFTAGGKGTRCLSQSQPDDGIDIFGPLGNGFTVNPSSRSLLLVAGGIGVAPLCFLAEDAIKAGESATLLLGAHSAELLLPRKLMPAGINLVIATEDGKVGRKGFVTDLLPDYVNSADQVFACGPMPFYRTLLTSYGNLLKAKPVQVSLETRMGCGVGVCYSCTVKTAHGLKQTCKDGPIFDINDVLWDELPAEGRHVPQT